MNIIKKIILGLLCLVMMYGIVFHIVQFFNKPSGVAIIDINLHQPLLQQVQLDNKEESVVVQYQSQMNQDDESYRDDLAAAELQGDFDSDEPIILKSVKPIVVSPQDSFVTIEFQHAGKLDDRYQYAFDLLIGNNIDALLDLIAQSNNNFLSIDSCKTCAIDAILKKVSKHKHLSEQELVSLQHVTANLYKFINTMQKLTHKNMLAPEQLVALKNLNTSQLTQNNLNMQARQAATLAALQTLQNVDMVERHG